MPAMCTVLLATILMAFSPVQKSEYQAEIVQVRLVDWTNPEGRELQMLLVDWKNTGKQPIGKVKATMTVFDADGRLIYEAKDYSIFVTYDPQNTIKPGKTYIEPAEKGHVVMPLDRSRGISAKAVLTNVSGIPAI